MIHANQWIIFTLIIICIVLEAFFSGSEIALVSFGKLELKKIEKKKSKVAKILKKLLESPENFLTTTLIGTNLSVITGSTIYTSFIATKLSQKLPDFLSHPEIITTLSFTPVTLLFGELIPKSIAYRHSSYLAPAVAYPLSILQKLLEPIIILTSLISKPILKVIGGMQEIPSVTKEEIETLLKTTHIAFDKTEREILKNVLKLKEQNISKIYIPLVNVVAISRNSSISDAIKLIEQTGFSRLPVYANRFDNIIGYISIIDLIEASSSKEKIDRYIKSIPVLTEYMNLLDALEEFKKTKMQIAIVVDEFGSTLGIITVEDILEEVVGEIEDEFDRTKKEILLLEDGSVIASGNAQIKHINEFLKIPLPESEDYTTVAGLILKVTGRLPHRGERIKLERHTIIIRNVEPRRIKSVLIKIN